VRDLHQLPAEQFLEAGADVGSRDSERLADLVGIQRLFRQIEQGVDLRHGAVHPPAAAHFAPVDDVSMHGVGEVHFVPPVISVITEITGIAGGLQARISLIRRKFRR
jgi:hypothetical protein